MLERPITTRACPGELDVVLAQELHDPGGGRGRKRGPAEEQEARVDRVEAVHVLDRLDRPDDPGFVDLAREGELHEDAGHALVGVQAGDEPEQIVLG